jgi:4-amino-4-deoxy-L-arabinose transferase-like glycosyltransferase
MADDGFDSATRAVGQRAIRTRSRTKGAALGVAVLGIALAVRLFAAWAIPFANGTADPNCAPDEAGHFGVADALAHGRAPTWPEESWTVYAIFPPVQYAVQAATLALGNAGLAFPVRFPSRVARARSYALPRLGSVLLGVVTVALLAVTVWTWTESEIATLVAALAAALYPQLVFISAYTNGDAFTVAAGATLVLALSVWVRRGEGERGLATVGAALGLVALGKVYGYAALPSCLGWIVWAARARRIGRRALARALAATALVAGPVLVWNGVRNGGDLLGLARWGMYVRNHYPTAAPPPDAVTRFARELGRSAFGVFRNLDLLMPAPFYVLAAILLVIGVSVTGCGLNRISVAGRRAAACLGIYVVAAVALAALNAWFVDFQPQGRYVLLAAVLCTLVAACGPLVLRPRAARLWAITYVAFLAASTLAMAVLLYRNPCRPVDEGVASWRYASSREAA